MGIESFDVRLTLPASAPIVAAALRDRGFHDLRAEGAFLRSRPSSLIEALILGQDAPTSLSLRFAICQGAAAFADFSASVTELAELLEAEVVVGNDVPAGVVSVFAPGNYEDLQRALFSAMHLELAKWIAEFGPEPTLLTCDQAIRQLVLRQGAPRST